MATCAHCWHYQNGYTNGMASAGGDNYLCCWCGVSQARKWTAVSDPRHGAHANVTIRVYSNGQRVDD